jgi:hypothetical protein
MLGFRCLDSSLLSDAAGANRRRRRDEDAQEIVACTKDKRGAVCTDHDVTLCSNRLDRISNEAAQLVASWGRPFGKYRRGHTTSSHHGGCSGRAELVEDAPKQRLSMLGVCNEPRRRAGSLSGRRNDLLVDVSEPQLIRHEPRHVVATCSIAMRDANERPWHAIDVTPLLGQPQGLRVAGEYRRPSAELQLIAANAFLPRSAISSGERSSLCVAISHWWPYGSATVPKRSPQN